MELLKSVYLHGVRIRTGLMSSQVRNVLGLSGLFLFMVFIYNIYHLWYFVLDIYSEMLSKTGSVAYHIFQNKN